MRNALLAGLPPVHPGEVLSKDVLPGLNKPKVEVARLLGITSRSLDGVLCGTQTITADMALRIGKLTDTTPEMWLNLQRDHDEATAA